MIKHNSHQAAICERLRKLGYAQDRKIRLYGEEYLLTSNPTAEEDGFAVEVISCRLESRTRLRIPLPIVQTLKRELGVLGMEDEVALAA